MDIKQYNERYLSANAGNWRNKVLIADRDAYKPSVSITCESKIKLSPPSCIPQPLIDNFPDLLFKN